MRYIVQGAVMAGDILLIAAVACVLWVESTNLLCWVLAWFVFRTWHKAGGFEAWDPATIRKFMENAKRLGL